MKKTKWFSSQYATIDLKDRRQRRRLRFFIIGGALELLVLALIGFRAMHFMESQAFCGIVCHRVMEPEYTVFQKSPHAKVPCVQCHIGPGATWMVKSKINGIPQVFKTIANAEERPIPTPVENLRPARDTCEECHWPSKFSGDMVRVFRHFKDDEANTEANTTNVYKVGGGEKGMARDIHWHIGNDVWYLPMDPKRQIIGWVGVENDNGGLREFIDPARASEMTPTRIEDEKRLMDCVDSHNRATHIFRTPSQMMDDALAARQIDRNIPFIKKKGVEVLTSSPRNIQGKIDNAEALLSFYQTSYPDLYNQQGAVLRVAIDQLKELAKIVEFPDMNVDWKTHLNNIGHLESPGCFRCHGKLVARAAPDQNKVIGAVCEECHYPLNAAPTPAEKPATPSPATPKPDAPGGTVAAQAPAPPTPPAKPSGPPKIPASHSTSGCPVCHKDGLGGAPKSPANHSSFPDAMCGSCHQKS